ncbi:universal stress protein [Mariniflexile ostreae]|uniref:Universal stress protein n=1 Tax=Mariniflexile ostreae TaxID=1520892 RepID=A0ABV5F9J8_9FLAO
MKKILLPTDFSNNSWNAIAYALQLFKNESCTFYVLNTYTPMIYHAEHVLVNSAQFEMVDAVREMSLTQLNDIKNRIERDYPNPNHIIETLSTFNTLIPEIRDVVESKSIDYVVMGTKGATGAQEILFGSNTVHVFKNIKCPVLAIPEGYTFKDPKAILFPTDYEIDYKNKQIKPILNMVSLFDSTTHILNVSYGYDLSEDQKTNKHNLETYFKQTQHTFHSVSNNSVQEAITNFQLENNIQLLVMINNKHSFFENLFFKSTINQIGFNLKIPFLVIPSKLENS